MSAQNQHITIHAEKVFLGNEQPLTHDVSVGLVGLHDIRATFQAKFIKLDAGGAHLPADATDFYAIFNTRAGFAYRYAADKSDDLRQEKCVDEAAAVAAIAGYTPFQLIEDKDAEAIINRRFVNPAVDPEEFPGILSGWHWTRTDDAQSSVFAWHAGFSYGDVDRDLRDYRGRALAVCRPLASRQ